jgi:hypothetical protein
MRLFVATVTLALLAATSAHAQSAARDQQRTQDRMQQQRQRQEVQEWQEQQFRQQTYQLPPPLSRGDYSYGRPLSLGR